MRHDAADTADGTQPSDPSMTFADPLAGVAGGERSGPGSNGASNGGNSGPARPTAPNPTAPNPETVRTLLNDVFAPASERASADADAEPDPAAATIEDQGSDTGESAPITPVERSGEENRPGMLPAQRGTWPSTRRLTRQAWRPRGRAGRRKQPAAIQRPPSLKPTRGFAGVTVAILLLLLFVAVGVQFVVSFVGMFTGTGG